MSPIGKGARTGRIGKQGKRKSGPGKAGIHGSALTADSNDVKSKINYPTTTSSSTTSTSQS